MNHFLSGPASFRSHSSSGLGLARAAPGSGDGVSGGEGGRKKWEKLSKKSGRMFFIPPKHGDGLKSVFVCLFVSYLFIGAVVFSCFILFVVFICVLLIASLSNYLLFLGIYIEFT